MSRQGDGTQSHINFESHRINVCQLTYMNDAGIFDENYNHDTPLTLPSSEKKLRERIK